MEERRSARVGTVSGLALLAGGTAVAGVAGGHHSVFATLLLGMLACGMAHATLDEIRRQARRSAVGGWATQDTLNTGLLAAWAVVAALATALADTPVPVRAVGLSLVLGYAVTCGYFVVERRRSITMTSGTTTAPSGSSGSGIPSGPTTSEPSTATPGTGSLPDTDTSNTAVVPDGYGMSSR